MRKSWCGLHCFHHKMARERSQHVTSDDNNCQHRSKGTRWSHMSIKALRSFLILVLLGNGAVVAAQGTRSPVGNKTMHTQGNKTVQTQLEIPDSFVTASPSLTPSTSPLPSSKSSSLPKSLRPSESPSSIPSKIPSPIPSKIPSTIPTIFPTVSTVPTLAPSASQLPSSVPSSQPTSSPPSESPSSSPTTFPSVSRVPSGQPSFSPTEMPSASPSGVPSALPTLKCHDVASYRSPINNLTCEDHANTDCTRWRYVGLNITDLQDLVESCPVTCDIPCG